MARMKLVNGVPVEMTPNEESARDAEEAAWTSTQEAQAAEAARVNSYDTAIGNDTMIQHLKGLTATQFDQWWDGNVTNAAQAIGVLKKLCKIILRHLT